MIDEHDNRLEGLEGLIKGHEGRLAQQQQTLAELEHGRGFRMILEGEPECQTKAVERTSREIVATTRNIKFVTGLRNGLCAKKVTSLRQVQMVSH